MSQDLMLVASMEATVWLPGLWPRSCRFEALMADGWASLLASNGGQRVENRFVFTESGDKPSGNLLLLVWSLRQVAVKGRRLVFVWSHERNPSCMDFFSVKCLRWSWKNREALEVLHWKNPVKNPLLYFLVGKCSTKKTQKSLLFCTSFAFGFYPESYVTTSGDPGAGLGEYPRGGFVPSQANGVADDRSCLFGNHWPGQTGFSRLPREPVGGFDSARKGAKGLRFTGFLAKKLNGFSTKTFC